MTDSYPWNANGVTVLNGKTVPGEETLMTFTLAVDVYLNVDSAIVIYGDADEYEYFDAGTDFTFTVDNGKTYTATTLSYGNDGTNNYLVITNFTYTGIASGVTLGIEIGAQITLTNVRVKLSAKFSGFSTAPVNVKTYYLYTSFRDNNLSTDIMMGGSDSTLSNYVTTYHAI